MLTAQEIQSWVSLWIQKSTYILLTALKCVTYSILYSIERKKWICEFLISEESNQVVVLM